MANTLQQTGDESHGSGAEVIDDHRGVEVRYWPPSPSAATLRQPLNREFRDNRESTTSCAGCRRCPAEGAMLDHRKAGRVLDVVVGAEPEAVVLVLRRGVHPPTLVADERPLLSSAATMYCCSSAPTASIRYRPCPMRGKLRSKACLRWKEVPHHDDGHCRRGLGGETTNSPAHAVSVSLRSRTKPSRGAVEDEVPVQTFPLR